MMTTPGARNLPDPGAVRDGRLHRDWAHPCPHLCRDWAHPDHICAGTGLTPAHICAGTGTSQTPVRRATVGSGRDGLCSAHGSARHTRSMQRSAYDMHHAARIMQRAACNVQRAARSVRRSYSIRRARTTAEGQRPPV
jgi:hypothetical protein